MSSLSINGDWEFASRFGLNRGLALGCLWNFLTALVSLRNIVCTRPGANGMQVKHVLCLPVW